MRWQNRGAMSLHVCASSLSSRPRPSSSAQGPVCRGKQPSQGARQLRGKKSSELQGEGTEGPPKAAPAAPPRASHRRDISQPRTVLEHPWEVRAKLDVTGSLCTLPHCGPTHTLWARHFRWCCCGCCVWGCLLVAPTSPLLGTLRPLYLGVGVILGCLPFQAPERLHA